MFFLNMSRLTQYIKNILLTDSSIHSFIIDTINSENYIKFNDIAVKQNELLQLVYETIENINQKFESFETELLQKVNKLVDSIYSDDEYLQLVKKVDDSKIVNRQTAINLIELHSKLIDVQLQLRDLEQRKETESIESIVSASIKKTRTDIATITSKVKNEIKELDIKLDAFIDTISEKIAKPEIKQKRR
jgi:MFS superfamily sulfate permease-like transporter